MVEDFASQFAKILTNRKTYKKMPDFFYALLNFNHKSTGHNFANSHFFAFQGNTDLEDSMDGMANASGVQWYKHVLRRDNDVLKKALDF